VAPRNAGIVEHAGEPIEQCLLSAERLARTGLGFVLFDH
jgi:hypothetical protein